MFDTHKKKSLTVNNVMIREFCLFALHRYVSLNLEREQIQSRTRVLLLPTYIYIYMPELETIPPFHAHGLLQWVVGAPTVIGDGGAGRFFFPR